MMNVPPVLSVRSLEISFPGATPVKVVDNVSFDLQPGRTLAIVGESGSGKSLTALALMGLQPRQAKVSGQATLHAEGKPYDLTRQTTDSWRNIRGKLTGMVFQEPMSSLNPVMKAGRQLAECILAHQNVSAAQAKQIAISWLERVQLPEPDVLYHRYPHQLSGGQKQRVMIAMAMCNHPSLLIADEPTTALDVTVQMEVVKLMKELQQQTGTAMIFITHDLELAATIADDLLVMYKGVVVEYGNAKRIFTHPQHFYSKALIACKPSEEQKGKVLPIVADFLNAENDKKDLVASLVSQPGYSAEQSNTTPLLQVNNLRVWFTAEKDWLGRTLKHFKAVNDVSFQLNKGEILGLVGESGCGKSTLSRSLLGLIPVHDGHIFFEGKDLAKADKSDWRAVRSKMQMIFQDPFASLNPRMSVADMLAEPLLVHQIVPPADVQREVLRLLDMVHLTADSLKKYPHEFSGGQRQRLGIARALALRPKLLICDESVSALDVSVQAQVLNLLKEIQAEFGLSYLFISHDLAVVHYISDSVMVMQSGQIVESGSAQQVLKQPGHPYTQKLVASIPGRNVDRL